MLNKSFPTSSVFNFKEKIEYSDGSVVSKTIIKKPVGTVTLFSFDEGQSISTHSASYDALVQVLEGTTVIVIADESFEISEGGSIILPANIPHAVHAKGRFKMLLTMIKE